MKHVYLVVIVLALAACEQSQPQAPQAERAAESAPVVPKHEDVQPAPTSAPTEPLPRAVGDVTLGASLADVQAKLGALDCHDNPEGFRVCSPKAAPPGTPRNLEVFLFHDHVVSLAHENDTGPDVWNYVRALMARFGTPSLNGARNQDNRGRTHEIYGWKDEQSLYSVRFIWDSDTADRRLTATTITLWDRKAYRQWEEQKKSAQPAPAFGEPT